MRSNLFSQTSWTSEPEKTGKAKSGLTAPRYDHGQHQVGVNLLIRLDLNVGFPLKLTQE